MSRYTENRYKGQPNLCAEIVLLPVWAAAISISGITRLPVTSSTMPLNSSTSKHGYSRDCLKQRQNWLNCSQITRRSVLTPLYKLSCNLAYWRSVVFACASVYSSVCLCIRALTFESFDPETSLLVCGYRISSIYTVNRKTHQNIFIISSRKSSRF